MTQANQIYIAHAVPVSITRVMTGLDHYQYVISGQEPDLTEMMTEADINAGFLRVGEVSHLPEYVQRVHIERAQLADKLSKLTAFISTAGFLDLPDDDRHLLEHQLDAMSAYRRILDQRIDNFANKLLEGKI